MLWSTQVGGKLRAPVVAGNVVYVSGDETHQVTALDRSSGGRLWTFDVDGGNECCIAVARGLTFVETLSGTVYAIGGDGAQLVAQTAPSVTTRPSSAPPSAAPPATFPPLLPATLAWAVDSGDPEFIPWGLARDPEGNLWAAESLNDRFAIFSADGRFIETWGKGGAGDGEFDLTRANGDPYGMVAFAPDGSFYVLDPGNRQIDLFAANRRFIRSWGGFGSQPGSFNDPVSIAVDGDGNVSVLDDLRQVIETFDAEGHVLKTISAFPPEAMPRAGANQLALGPNGHFYVSIIGPNEVVEVDEDGKFVRVYGGGASATNPFTEQPNVVKFDSQGRVYVTQGPLRGSRPGVVIFDADGNYLGGFGALGSAKDQLGFAWGLVVLDDGIYVADSGGIPDVGLSSLIRKFEPIEFP